MFRYFTFFISILVPFLSLKAQSVFNCELIHKMSEIAMDERIQVLVLTKPNSELPSNIKQNYQVGTIYSLVAGLNELKELAKLPQVVRIEYTEHRLQLMGDTCMVRNRLKNAKAGMPPLAQPYDGTGVIIGIIDSGTDFNHPDFKNSNGTSRINYLWDMNKPLAANTPTPFGYGQEWTNTQIDNGQCTHSDASHYGHGTASSGIAAGNGFAINHYEGVAPKADIIVVALDFGKSGNTISDAVQYIINKAQLLGKPFVINASVGDYYGSHDGTDLEAQLINNQIGNIPGRAMVASAGNGGSIPFHVGYNVTVTDTGFSWIRNGASVMRLSEFADTNQIKYVQYSVGVNNGAYHNLGRIGFKSYNYALNTLKRDTLYHGNHRIGVIESVASINSFGVYELSLKIKADSLNYLWRIEHTGTGRIDSWNFDYVTSPLPSVSLYPQIVSYKKADTTQTIVSSFQCSDEIITVANYVNRNQYKDVNNNTQITSEVPGQIASSSSVGPTRDNRIKPDIAASGATIITATELTMLPNLTITAPQVVAYGGFHVPAGGTSASGPVVAGLAALYLQKNPTATNRQLKQAIIDCAYRDGFTTTNLPNYRWGYGKLDGFGAMICGMPMSGLQVYTKENNVTVYPNPLISGATIHFNTNGKKSLKLYNAAGALLFSDEANGNNYVLNRNNLSAGLYLLVSEEAGIINKVKLMIQ